MHYSEFDFEIKAQGQISDEFKKRGIHSFKEAAQFVAHLPYRRNVNKLDLRTVFDEQCGTCSTKHALLKTLAGENNDHALQLMMGVFKMNAVNTKLIAATLEKHQLNYIPEAHMYLKLEDQILDFTKAGASATDFEDDLLTEVEIEPGQITDHKVSFHKQFLDAWIAREQIGYTPDEIWQIREQCIRDLSV